MKLLLPKLIALSLFIGFSGCKPDEPGEGLGTLIWKTKTGAAKMNRIVPGSNKVDSTYSCTVIDVANELEFLSVSSGTMVEGQPDDLTWHQIISDDGSLHYSNDRTDVSIDVPAGTYGAIKLRQGYNILWKVDWNGTEIEIPDFNQNCDSNAYSTPNGFIQYLTPTGVFYETAAHNFTECYCCGQESMGGFTVSESKTTTVTMRLNIASLDWIDSDNSGTWTSGDYLDNWATFSGNQMTVFDVEYE